MQEKNHIHRTITLLALLSLLSLVLISISFDGRAASTEEPYAASAAAALAPEPELSAHAYLVELAQSGEILAARRPSKPLAPASLTKLMTAFIAVHTLEPDAVVILSPDAAAVEEAGERTIGAPAGRIFARDSLLSSSLASSANDAARALAEEIGRRLGHTGFQARIAAFKERMNLEARALGLERSRFENPTGLDAAGHYMSAQDIARLAKRISREEPRLWDMTLEPQGSVFALDGSEYPFRNTNDLLSEFPAIRGGKTGYTDEARGALTLLYPVAPDDTAVIVILKSEDRFGDGRKIIHWLEQNFP